MHLLSFQRRPFEIGKAIETGENRRRRDNGNGQLSENCNDVSFQR